MRYFLLLLFLYPFLSLAQLHEDTRFEQKIPKKLDYTFEMLPLIKEKKVILFGEKEAWAENTKKRKYYFKILDSTLKQTSEKEFNLDRRWLYEGNYTDSTNLYLLFYTDNHKEFVILVYTQSGDIEYKTGILPFNFQPSSFVVFGNNAFLIGQNKGKDVVIDYSFFDNTVKVIPSFFDEKYDIKNIEINNQESIANILIQESKRGDKNFFIRRVLSNGKQVSENKFSFDKEKYPTDLEPITINNQHYLMGLYGDGQSHLYSQGWIWIKYDPENPNPYMKQESFDNVKNFFVYFPKKVRQEKEREKVFEKKEEGKSYTYRLRFRLHKPIFYNNQIIVVAESFNAAYQHNTNFPNPVMSTNPMFMNLPPTNRGWRGSTMPSYQFVHAIVLAFDLKGDLLWDNAIRIKDITKSYLDENVTFIPHKEKSILLQCHEKGINIKVFKQNEVIYENETIPYQKSYNIVPRKDDKIRANNSKILGWYDDYILVTGIYNPKAHKFFSSEDDIFYIAKVKFAKPESK
ncbi:MAG: hypothetical protein MUC49_17785 [Raineya sp.]|jgi:hypothetical protein|nr:hypothetical protein [Raineya sp.]